MKIAVLGLWHLGTVTAACLARLGHTVTGIECDAAVVERLQRGEPPVDEPGLGELLAEGIAAGRLFFSADPHAAAGAEVVWAAHDTPVDEEDRADVSGVMADLTRVAPHMDAGAVLLVSAQLPAGTAARVEAELARLPAGRPVSVAVSPENLRLGKAVECFLKPERIIVGVRRGDAAARGRLEKLFASLAPAPVIWMGVESAEMTKHALNAFLATSVAFANEIAVLCERLGADGLEVAQGLKSDIRIGPRAYLTPGASFAGGTLARDLVYLRGLASREGIDATLLPAVKESNDRHKFWAVRRLEELLGGVAGKRVAVWGLTYKPGTDTLRRSLALEICARLAEKGATVAAHDPKAAVLPPGTPEPVQLAPDPLGAAGGADALVICTEWPEYRTIDLAEAAGAMRRPLLVDPNGFLDASRARDAGFEVVRVGKSGQ